MNLSRYIMKGHPRALTFNDEVSKGAYDVSGCLVHLLLTIWMIYLRIVVVMSHHIMTHNNYYALLEIGR